MQQISINTTKNSIENTTPRTKAHRTALEISHKIIAFEEVLKIGSKGFESERSVSTMLNIPNSTMQSWKNKKKSETPSGPLATFIRTPEGIDFLQKIVMAMAFSNKCGHGGIRGMQDFLHHSGLDEFVASSFGALQNFWVRCEDYILKFGEKEEERLSQKLKTKKITVGLDELFRGRKPCLVGIEVVSNYILIAKFTSDRKSATWNDELSRRMKTLGLKIFQVVSDLCGAIRSCTESMEAIHSADLFHGQYEISKATVGSLSAQERAAERALKKSEEDLRKIIETPRLLKEKDENRYQEDLIKGIEKRRELTTDYETKKNRKEKVREAKKKLGEIHHPVDLETGRSQSEESVRTKFKEQINVIKGCVKEAKLSKTCMDRVEKAERAFDLMATYMKNFFLILTAFIMSLGLTSEQELFFREVIFPLCYLRLASKRLSSKNRKRHKRLLDILESRLRESPWSAVLKEEWMGKGTELAEMFQRSSSCVEGTNGMFSLLHHRFHRLSERTLRVIAIVQNFCIRRPDGTTAANRLFKNEHEDLFAFLVANVRIPGKPQKQVRGGKQCAA